MEDAIISLEGKVGKIIALCDALRLENNRLRDRVGELENEKQRLMERMTEARTRLEVFMDRLPAE